MPGPFFGPYWQLSSISGATPSTNQFSVTSSAASTVAGASIYVHKVDARGTDVSLILDQLGIGDFICIVPTSGAVTPEVFATITGAVTSSGGVYTIPLGSGGGVGTFTASATYNIWFTKKGTGGAGSYNTTQEVVIDFNTSTCTKTFKTMTVVNGLITDFS